MSDASTKSRYTRGYVRASNVELNPVGRPFFKGRLDKKEVHALVEHFEACASEERTWYTIASIEPDLTRLTITRARTPQYESQAFSTYARGDIFRVSGGNQSCNIDFCGGTGAEVLASRLKSAESRMQHFVEIRVPSRNRHIIEFIPDRELPELVRAEDEVLGELGESLAAEVWPVDDFSDWE